MVCSVPTYASAGPKTLQCFVLKCCLQQSFRLNFLMKFRLKTSHIGRKKNMPGLCGLHRDHLQPMPTTLFPFLKGEKREPSPIIHKSSVGQQRKTKQSHLCMKFFSSAAFVLWMEWMFLLTLSSREEVDALSNFMWLQENKEKNVWEKHLFGLYES